jgi:hypothetical protein
MKMPCLFAGPMNRPLALIDTAVLASPPSGMGIAAAIRHCFFLDTMASDPSRDFQLFGPRFAISGLNLLISAKISALSSVDLFLFMSSLLGISAFNSAVSCRMA